MRLRGQGRFDLLYGQDLGMAEENAVRTNELYASQYLGHTVEGEGGGRTIRSRQNLPQRGGRCPVVRQGMLAGGVRGYCTDALQFFGLGAKRGDVPAALANGLPGAVLQYEGAFVGLQSENDRPRGNAANLLREMCADGTRVDQGRCGGAFAGPRRGRSREGLAERSPMRARRSWARPTRAGAFPRGGGTPLARAQAGGNAGGELLRLLHRVATTHVALAAKETASRRPHGTILMSAQTPNRCRKRAGPPSTAGVFAFQTVIGNTSFTRAFPHARNLNLQSHSACAVSAHGWKGRLLTMPRRSR